MHEDEIIETKDLYDPSIGDIGKGISIKSNRIFKWIMPIASSIGLYFISAEIFVKPSFVLFVFFFIVSSIFFVSIADALYRGGIIIIDKSGITIKEIGSYSWESIQRTFIKIEDNSSGDSINIHYYLILETKKGIVEYRILGLEKDYKEIGHYVEAGKLKFSEQGLSFRLKT